MDVKEKDKGDEVSWSWEQVAEENKTLKARLAEKEKDLARAKLERAAAQRDAAKARAALRIVHARDNVVEVQAPALVVVKSAS